MASSNNSDARKTLKLAKAKAGDGLQTGRVPDLDMSFLFFFGDSGSEKGVFWKRGLLRKVHFLEILEILENRQTVENKGESDHFLEILEDLENLDLRF